MTDPFNVAWEVLLGVAATWWVTFTALLNHSRDTQTWELDRRLSMLAGRFPRRNSREIVEAWQSRLSSVDVVFCCDPDVPSRLLTLKWFLAGLLCSGAGLMTSALPVYGLPPEQPCHRAVYVLSSLTLILCAAIFVVIVSVSIKHDGVRAFSDMANPTRWALQPTTGTQEAPKGSGS